jgi:Outer membrane lipoprotein
MRGPHYYFVLVLVSALTFFALNAQAQEKSEPPESTGESLAKAETEIGLLQSGQTPDQLNVSTRAWRRLKAIRQQDPDAGLRARVEQDMITLEEFLGNHELSIAEFYLGRRRSTRAARSRFLHIADEYPHFSKLDRVFLRLADTYVRENNQEFARIYLLKLVCRYPASDYSMSAFNELNRIGFRSWEGCDKYLQ